MPLTAAQPARFTLLLFGIFRLCGDGKDIPLRGRKACALLAFLLLAKDQRASREQIADRLWTDRGSEQARASLRQTLAELRAIAGMGEALDIARSEIALRPGHFDSDFGDVLVACEGADLASLAQALTGLRGGLLDGFGDVSPGFDEWLAIERGARTEQLVAASLACVEQHGMTRPEETHAVLRALDRLDPFNEGVARLGMRLDHAAGDSASLHRRYRRLADQLQGEFGAAPAEATRSLFQQLTKERDAGTSDSGQPPALVPVRIATSADELMPAVVVAPLQVAESGGLTKEQAAFCGDDMRAAISAMHGLRVLAADAADISNLLMQSADSLALYLLSGTVRDPGSGPVATMQLANARDRSILWSASVHLNDVASPVEAIVAKAVGALQPAIDRDLDAAMRASPDLGDERAMYTRARLMIRGAANLAETLAGVDALLRIIERNPRHLGTHLLLARMYNSDFWQQMSGHDPLPLRERGAHHAQIAAGLAPDRVDVRVRRAWVLLRKGAYASAAKDLEAVLTQRQLDTDILNQCAMGFCLLGDLERAQALMQQAFELNPFAPSDYHADYATMKALAGEAEEAEEHFLVSGETGLLYDAVRIANFAQVTVPAPIADEVQSRFARKFTEAWQADGTPRTQDVIAWMATVLPLRAQEHRDFLGRGLDQRLPTFWPPS